MSPSSKSTESESTNPPSIVRTGVPTKRDEQVGTLQTRLDRLEDDRLEERFIWFAVCGLFFNVIAYMAAGGVAGGFVSLIYVALLLVLSKKWGFEGLWEALYQARDLLKGNKPEA